MAKEYNIEEMSNFSLQDLMANNLSIKKSKLDLSVYFNLIPSDVTACISNKEQMYFFSCRIPKVDTAY